MSGRIRTIKPELLEDAITAGLSHIAFRLFIGCILLADDYGNLRFEASFLRGQVLWAHDVEVDEFARAIEELVHPREGATEGLVMPYLVKGQRYAAVRGWSKHQRVQKPGRPRVPSPPPCSPETSSPELPPDPEDSGDLPEDSGKALDGLRTDHRSPITDPQSGSTRGAAREPTRTGVASLGGETPSVAELDASLDAPIPDTWRARAEAKIRGSGVDFGLPSTWAKYRAACVRDRRRLTEAGWIIWFENEARFAADRQARRDDTLWGKFRPAVAEPGAPPFHAAAKPVETPDYDRDAALSAAAALAAGNFGPATRKAGGA